MRDHAVEGSPVLLIGVETLVEELSQETPILRWAEGVGIPRRDRPGLLVFYRRCHVAQSREPKPGDDGALRLVAHLVDVPRLITALKIKRGESGTISPSFTRPNCHWSRGIVRCVPRNPSRTVSALAALAGSTGG